MTTLPRPTPSEGNRAGIEPLRFHRARTASFLPAFTPCPLQKRDQQAFRKRTVAPARLSPSQPLDFTGAEAGIEPARPEGQGISTLKNRSISTIRYHKYSNNIKWMSIHEFS